MSIIVQCLSSRASEGLAAIPVHIDDVIFRATTEEKAFKLYKQSEFFFFFKHHLHKFMTNRLSSQSHILNQ